MLPRPDGWVSQAIAPRKAVELPHDQDVAFAAHEAECGLEFGPVALGPGGFLDEDALAAGFLEGIELELGALLLGRDAGIADEHGRILPKVIERVSFREMDFKGAIWEIHRRGIAWLSKPPSQSPEKGPFREASVIDAQALTYLQTATASGPVDDTPRKPPGPVPE